MTKRILALLFSLALLAACGAKHCPPPPDADIQRADRMATYYYMLRAKGYFADYVAAMQSCDGTTAKYKGNMENLLRHHQARIDKEKKGVVRVKALRYELHDNGRMANVFLSVSYGDHSSEEIIFPLVYDGKRWRIQ